jgi:hypothetical protein
MEDLLVLDRPSIRTDNKVKTSVKRNSLTSETNSTYPVVDNLIAEGGDPFFHYLNHHGLANDPNMLVLPSQSHFYYDHSELKGVTTLINLKKLNMIKHLDSFLHSLYHVLSPKSNFIGCYSDWKTQKKNGLPARMYKGFINFIDARIDVEFDKKDVSRLLESHGFKVVDVTEINGVSYFRAQNMRRSAE